MSRVGWSASLYCYSLHSFAFLVKSLVKAYQVILPKHWGFFIGSHNEGQEHISRYFVINCVKKIFSKLFSYLFIKSVLAEAFSLSRLFLHIFILFNKWASLYTWSCLMKWVLLKRWFMLSSLIDIKIKGKIVSRLIQFIYYCLFTRFSTSRTLC